LNPRSLARNGTCNVSHSRHGKKIGCQAESLKYFLRDIRGWWRPEMKRELDPPNKSGESRRARRTTWAGPENRLFHGFYGNQRGGSRPHRMAHKALLKDPQVRRWYDNVSRGSELTAQAYLRRLGLFCRRWHSTPAGLLRKRPRDTHNLLADTVTELESKGYAGSYGQSIVKAVKSWLSVRGGRDGKFDCANQRHAAHRIGNRSHHADRSQRRTTERDDERCARNVGGCRDCIYRRRCFMRWHTGMQHGDVEGLA